MRAASPTDPVSIVAGAVAPFEVSVALCRITFIDPLLGRPTA
jgi:hypothetical protein